MRYTSPIIFRCWLTRTTSRTASSAIWKCCWIAGWKGLIVIANWLMTDIKLLADLTEKRVPTVVAGRAFEIKNVSTVSVDNEEWRGAGAGASLQIWGIARLRFYAGRRHSPAAGRGGKGFEISRNRWDCGWTRSASLSCQNRRIPIPVLRRPARLTTELLDAGKNVHALMAYDDMTALGALRALKKHGLRVPEDRSAWWDSTMWLRPAFRMPSLTTVRQPMESMGAMSVAMMLDAIKAVDQKQTFRWCGGRFRRS